MGWFGGEHDVTGANSDGDAAAHRGVAEGSFDFRGARLQADAHDTVVRARLDDFSDEEIFKTGGLSEGRLTRGLEYFKRRAGGGDSSVIYDDDSLAEGIDFGAAVSDIEDWNISSVVPGAQIVDDGFFEAGVEGGEGLVKKKEAWRSGERAGERDALTLAARETGGLTPGEFFEAEGANDFHEASCALRFGEIGEAVGNVFQRGHVGEKRERLKDVGDAALLRGNIDAAVDIEQDFVTKRDAACFGMMQAGDAIEQSGFTRA